MKPNPFPRFRLGRTAITRTSAVGAAVIAALTITLGVAMARSYGPVVVRAGNLVVRANGSIFPSALPKHERAPIVARVNGRVGTVDGSRVPPAAVVTVDVDKSFAVVAGNLPVCHRTEIAARSTAEAKRACSASIVGSGSAEAEVSFPEQAPFSARGPLVFFNGGVQGPNTLLLVHLYAPVPAPTAIVTTVKLRRINEGRLGLRAQAEIPAIAGGYGSVTGFDFSLGRSYRQSSATRGYLEAKCPTRNYLVRAEVAFKDKSNFRAAFLLPCGGSKYGAYSRKSPPRS